MLPVPKAPDEQFENEFVVKTNKWLSMIVDVIN